MSLMFITSASTYAQAPGYEGKHLYVDFQIGPRLNLLPDETNVRFYTPEGENLIPSYLTYQYGLGLNYVVAKGGIVVADITTHEKFYYRQQLLNTFSTELIKPRGYTIGLGYRFMNFTKKGFIAPVGEYWEIKPFILLTGFEALGRFNNEDFIPYAENKLYPEFDRIDYGLSVGYGVQTVWWDLVTVSYYMGMMFTPFIEPIPYYEDLDNLSITAFSPFLQESRVSGEIKMSFGILAF